MLQISPRESIQAGLRAFDNPEFVTEILSFLQDGPDLIILTSHESADLDGLGSILGLTDLLANQFPGKRIRSVIRSMNNLSKNFAQLLDIAVSQDLEEPDEPAVAILLDCNNPQITGFQEVLQLPAFQRHLIIDHHIQHAEGLHFADKYWVESEFTATSEIIVALAAHWNISLKPISASALLGGILYDSQKFRRADAPLFQAVRLLLLWGADYDLAQASFRTKWDASEQIARLKAAQRMQLKMVNDGIVALTHVSAYEASAARALLSLGADLAIAVASRSNETRTSIRARKQFLKELDISVAEDLLDPVAAEFGGFGGGHRAAGGLNIPRKVDPSEIYHSLLKRLQSRESSGKKKDQ